MSSKPLKIVFQVLIVWLPWAVRRRLLAAVFGFEIDPTARIGLSLVLPRTLIMGPHSSIGHGNFAHNLDEIRLDQHARIERLNWIGGYPANGERYFRAFPDRRPRLHLHEHAAILTRCIVDCTDEIVIGAFALLAGHRHQLITHAIDLHTANQACAPISIGRYCMVGTGSILLKGALLPDYSVLGAGSVVHKRFETTHTLYSGVPAQPVKALDANLAFFSRTSVESDLPEQPVR
jgi:acetyltransferase-like isoleucine patch superfamily enzyme